MDKFYQTVQDIAELMAEYDNSPDLIKDDGTIKLFKELTSIFNKNHIMVGIYKPMGKVEKIGVA